MADGYLMPHYRFLNPFNHALFAFVFVTLFLQESTFVGAIGSAIWIIGLGFIASGNLENRFETHQLKLVGFC